MLRSAMRMPAQSFAVPIVLAIVAALLGCSRESAPSATNRTVADKAPAPVAPPAAQDAPAGGRQPSVSQLDAQGASQHAETAAPAVADQPKETTSATPDSTALQSVEPAEDEDHPAIDFDKWAHPMEPPPEAKGLLRVNPKFDLWVDAKNKKLVLGGRVVLRKGNQLELFACLFRTKEHESIVTVRTRAADVHAMLMALGAMPGKPVRFRDENNEPAYRAAYGPEIDVLVYWTDKDGKRRSARAQEWVRHVQTKQELSVPWVFGGSGFFEDNEGKKHYLGEDGELLCVSNFPTAVMDLPIQSSADAASLMFEPFTERIPPVGTVVALVLAPRLPLVAPDPPPEE